jgi:hypothetical protein
VDSENATARSATRGAPEVASLSALNRRDSYLSRVLITIRGLLNASGPALTS